MQFVRKAEEALTGKKSESHESTESSNHGPHKSNLANKLDPRVDSDRDNRAAHTDATGLGATHGTTHGTTPATGTHSSALGSGTTHGTTSTNAGPHDSNIANKADPRVDSDRDNRARHEGLTGAGTTHGTSGVTGTGAGLGSTHGTTGTHSSTLGSGTTHGTTGSTNAGPHDSNIANKLDPRVDSDRDNRARHEGLTGAGTTHGTSGVAGTGAGLGSTHGTTGTHSSTLGSGTTHGTTSTNAGPHDSNIANKADPRVDSDRDNRARHEGLTGAGLGSTHSTTGSTNAGPHDSNIANKLDPRVDSDRDSRAQHAGLSGAGTGAGAGLGSTHHTTATGTHGSTLGSGTGATHNTIQEQPVYTTGGPIPTPGSSSTNAGPHSSNIANKLDPRVDSDRDSSAQHTSGLAGSTTHGTHTRGVPHSPALGGSGLNTAGHQDALAGSSYNTPATGTTTGATGTTGPHSSSIANKLDPRVDSDVTRAENEALHRQI
ncbi:uncharacterized protein N7500_000026 [Penicillium coprophilum]|uniref:uncharacterized protein n=1 Tax=Penicillium coprophilum TaxID=36646 RepID=UPI00239DF38D|nr:uncharacterized protein N7500_000026 [Penicillium coprophilum]KAJ5177327.1 hypothetical protein N7500_000026 [Penicillium coprophilum]